MSDTPAPAPLTADDEWLEVEAEASRLLRSHSRGVRGQVARKEDGLDWWVYVVTKRRAEAAERDRDALLAALRRLFNATAGNPAVQVIAATEADLLEIEAAYTQAEAAVKQVAGTQEPAHV